MLKQVQCVNFCSEDGKVKIYCDNDTPLGNLHDFLMQVKGNIVERMVEAQKQEQAVADSQKEFTQECCPE